MDIKAFFDSIDHDLLQKAIDRHTDCKWLKLYIRRWLRIPYQTSTGERIEREQGVPQGSVIGPLLANLFLHYVFDEWMVRNYPGIPFERYADDCICHCVTLALAQHLQFALQQRLTACKLELHPERRLYTVTVAARIRSTIKYNLIFWASLFARGWPGAKRRDTL